MLKWLLERENITFVIAVAGFAMSAASWVFTLVTQHKKIAITVSRWNCIEDVCFFYIGIENRSRLPISITKVELQTGDTWVTCTLHPEFIHSDTQHDSSGAVIASRVYYSLDMPIQIDSLGAACGYLLFQGPRQMLETTSTQATVRVSTNRGAAKKMKLRLPPSLADLENKI
jgi:hypothetical protein